MTTEKLIEIAKAKFQVLNHKQMLRIVADDNLDYFVVNFLGEPYVGHFVNNSLFEPMPLLYPNEKTYDLTGTDETQNMKLQRLV
jgi:hypothetical protein